jgi:formate dehydrogenase maturation protein FdhE
MEKILKINIKCHQCGLNNVKYTAWMHLEEASILKAVWCDYCNTPLMVRFIFNEDQQPKIIKILSTEEVLMPRKPETGITIKPRIKKRKKKSNE